MLDLGSLNLLRNINLLASGNLIDKKRKNENEKHILIAGVGKHYIGPVGQFSKKLPASWVG